MVLVYATRNFLRMWRQGLEIPQHSTAYLSVKNVCPGTQKMCREQSAPMTETGGEGV